MVYQDQSFVNLHVTCDIDICYGTYLFNHFYCPSFAELLSAGGDAQMISLLLDLSICTFFPLKIMFVLTILSIFYYCLLMHAELCAFYLACSNFLFWCQQTHSTSSASFFLLSFRLLVTYMDWGWFLYHVVYRHNHNPYYSFTQICLVCFAVFHLILLLTKEEDITVILKCPTICFEQ